MGKKGKGMDYKSEIIKMLEQLEDEKILRYIYILLLTW